MDFQFLRRGAKPEYLGENSREENLHQIQAKWNSIQTTMVGGVCSSCNNSAIHILLALFNVRFMGFTKHFILSPPVTKLTKALNTLVPNAECCLDNFGFLLNFISTKFSYHFKTGIYR